MKKILSIALLVVLVVTMMMGVVNAASKDATIEEIYKIGQKYGMTESDKLRLKRVVADSTDAQVEQLLVKAKEAAQVMDDAGVTDYNKLSAEQKNKLKTIANEAASAIGVTLTFKKGAVEIYRDGKLIETITNTEGKLSYTGNTTNVVLIASSIAVIALTAVIIKKRTAVA